MKIIITLLNTIKNLGVPWEFSMAPYTFTPLHEPLHTTGRTKTFTKCNLTRRL